MELQADKLLCLTGEDVRSLNLPQASACKISGLWFGHLLVSSATAPWHEQLACKLRSASLWATPFSVDQACPLAFPKNVCSICPWMMPSA